AVGLVLFRTLLGLALIIGALRLLLLGLFLLLGLLCLGPCRWDSSFCWVLPRCSGACWWDSSCCRSWPSSPEPPPSGAPPVSAPPDSATPQVGQAPGPCSASSTSAAAICWSLLARSARSAYWVPPTASHDSCENCRPP